MTDYPVARIETKPGGPWLLTGGTVNYQLACLHHDPDVVATIRPKKHFPAGTRGEGLEMVDQDGRVLVDRFRWEPDPAIMTGQWRRKLAARPVPDDLVPVALVPVEVFGATCDCHDHLEGTEEGVKCRGWGYGLSDAVSSWSDCNRAEGHIYRVDDTDPDHREPGETIRIFVSKSDLPWFEKRFGEQQHEEGS